MAIGLRGLFGKSGEAVAGARKRLHIPEWPAAVYAIGDVHGCLAQLRLLQQRILTDAAKIEGTKLIVLLGDYIDRGINSAGALDFLTSEVPGDFSRICLAGNHEVMMLEHVSKPRSGDQWLSLGGLETLMSYGIDSTAYLSASTRDRVALLQSHIPPRHLEFLRELPIMVTVPGVVFVHAGLRTGVALEDQTEQDLLWIREQKDLAAQNISVGGSLVVHGHTPGPEPKIVGRDINIDTGAFATGVLTAIRLRPQHEPYFLSVGAADLA